MATNTGLRVMFQLIL